MIEQYLFKVYIMSLVGACVQSLLRGAKSDKKLQVDLSWIVADTVGTLWLAAWWQGV